MEIGARAILKSRPDYDVILSGQALHECLKYSQQPHERSDTELAAAALQLMAEVIIERNAQLSTCVGV